LVREHVFAERGSCRSRPIFAKWQETGAKLPDSEQRLKVGFGRSAGLYHPAVFRAKRPFKWTFGMIGDWLLLTECGNFPPLRVFPFREKIGQGWCQAILHPFGSPMSHSLSATLSQTRH
jgi:hypothetical protein